MDLLGFDNYDDLKEAHSRWADSEMQTDDLDKENKWTQSIAVGGLTFTPVTEDDFSNNGDLISSLLPTSSVPLAPDSLSPTGDGC